MLESEYCQITANIHGRENIGFKNNKKEQTKVLEIEQGWGVERKKDSAKRRMSSEGKKIEQEKKKKA